MSLAVAVLHEDLKFQVSGPRGEKVITDMPPPMGGTGSGANPGWLLRAGLASCNATVIAMRAAQLGLQLKSLEFTVESESDNRGFLGSDDSVSAGLRNLCVALFEAGLHCVFAGMTVNERLCALGLMDEYDHAIRSRDRDRLRSILERVRVDAASIDRILDSSLGDA
jgi:uncharacterized OsmC-like protein